MLFRLVNFFQNPKNDPYKGNFVWEIDCVHSRSLKMLPGSWFRKMSVYIKAKNTNLHTYFPESIFKLRECAQPISRIKFFLGHLRILKKFSSRRSMEKSPKFRLFYTLCSKPTKMHKLQTVTILVTTKEICEFWARSFWQKGQICHYEPFYACSKFAYFLSVTTIIDGQGLAPPDRLTQSGKLRRGRLKFDLEKR